MERASDPFVELSAESLADEFSVLERRDMALERRNASAPSFAAPAIARLHGFDLLEQPLIRDLEACPGQVIACRSTVPLRRAMIGGDVLVLFESGDVQRPLIVGVIQSQALQDVPAAATPGVRVEADGERHLIEAEREIVLRCGDASITLTRAGKVIIKGNYILSRSTGYNKIKGAAIDLN